MQIIARKIIENGEEVIELDLNKPWPKKKARYRTYMDEVERLSTRPVRTKKEFIKVVN